MKIDSVIRLVNMMVAEEKYQKARTLINKEWDRITEAKNFYLLSTNAQQFVKILKDEKENGSLLVLSNSDKKVLELVNRYVYDLQLHFARRIFKEHKVLLEKPEAQSWLTADARYIFEAWKKAE